MKNKKFFAILLLTISLMACSPKGDTPVSTIEDSSLQLDNNVAILVNETSEIQSLTITYIGIEGVMISKGESKILIDALHDLRVPENIQSDLITGVPPFDEIDLLLVTHNHSDHFNVQMVGDFLINNPETKMLSTSETINDLIEGYGNYEVFFDRIEVLDPPYAESSITNLQGLDIEVFNIPHGVNFPILNNAYLVEMGGVKVFHSGDAAGFSSDYLVEYGLAEKEIDIYLFSWQYLAGESFSMEDADKILNGKFYFPLHGPSADVVQSLGEYENVVFFENALEKWVFLD